MITSSASPCWLIFATQLEIIIGSTTTTADPSVTETSAVRSTTPIGPSTTPSVSPLEIATSMWSQYALTIVFVAIGAAVFSALFTVVRILVLIRMKRIRERREGPIEEPPSPSFSPPFSPEPTDERRKSAWRSRHRKSGDDGAASREIVLEDDGYSDPGDALPPQRNAPGGDAASCSEPSCYDTGNKNNSPTVPPHLPEQHSGGMSSSERWRESTLRSSVRSETRSNALTGSMGAFGSKSFGSKSSWEPNAVAPQRQAKSITLRSSVRSEGWSKALTGSSSWDPPPPPRQAKNIHDNFLPADAAAHPLRSYIRGAGTQSPAKQINEHRVDKSNTQITGAPSHYINMHNNHAAPSSAPEIVPSGPHLVWDGAGSTSNEVGPPPSAMSESSPPPAWHDDSLSLPPPPPLAQRDTLPPLSDTRRKRHGEDTRLPPPPPSTNTHGSYGTITPPPPPASPYYVPGSDVPGSDDEGTLPPPPSPVPTEYLDRHERGISPPALSGIPPHDGTAHQSKRVFRPNPQRNQDFRS